jgi:predicted HAD superfamily Cof-like phosphohydrolase
MNEEFKELDAAIANFDLIQTVDGLVDCLYVIYGTANAMGVDLEPAFDCVHANNMTKLWTSDQIHQAPEGAVMHCLMDTQDTRIRVMVDGKAIKPPSHPTPNLEAVLEDQHAHSNFPTD